jgi:hypothetical protein
MDILLIYVAEQSNNHSMRSTRKNRWMRRTDKYKDGGIAVVKGAIIPPEVIQRFREFEKTLMD